MHAVSENLEGDGGHGTGERCQIKNKRRKRIMAQNYSSKGTSINRTKLPSIYRKLGSKIQGKRILDYGCGRYVDHIEKYLKTLNCHPYFFDPYNRTGEQNMDCIHRYGLVNQDVVICSNVLNVIDDDVTVDIIIKTLQAIGKDVYITVYEGDKSGKGRQTGPDQYQRNEKASAYLERIQKLGYWAELKNGVIHMRRK